MPLVSLKYCLLCPVLRHCSAHVAGGEWEHDEGVDPCVIVGDEEAKMEYKPDILNKDVFNPPGEVMSVIRYCAKRGIKGKIGDPLPVGITGESCDWINKHHLTFEMLISSHMKAIRGY
jgi:hypothetical protein